MTEEQKQSTGGIPPKLTLSTARPPTPLPPPVPAPEGSQPTQVVQPPVKKQTTRIDLSSVPGVPPPPVKRQTAKITLMGAEIASQATAKTIRLPPTQTKPESAPEMASIPEAPTGRLVQPDEAVKSKTSRIPLEAANEAAGVPKTIRIKRPGQTSATIKITKPGAEGPTVEDAPPPDAIKSKTAQIDVSHIAAEQGSQPTQRKTIRIRRPDGGVAQPAPRTLQVARLESELEELAEEKVEGPGVVFAILALAATLVAAVMVYELVAQAVPSLGFSLPGGVSI